MSKIVLQLKKSFTAMSGPILSWGKTEEIAHIQSPFCGP